MSPLSLRDYVNGLAYELGARKVPTMPIVLARFLAFIGDIINTVGLKSFPFNSFRLNNILTEYQFDMSKTKKVCGELPYSISDGIKETVEWYKTTR